MLTRIFFLSSFLSSAVVAQAATYTQTVESTPGLLAYYQFSNSTQANSSVNSYTGTFVGGAAVGPAGSGPVLADDPTNTPVVLDGTTGYVNTNLTGGINSSGSMVGWFNLAALPSTVGHIETIAGESVYANDFDLQIDSGTNQIQFFTDSSSHTATNALTAGDLNKWIFVAATFTSATDRNIYVGMGGGPLASYSSAPGSHGTGPGTFAMGYSDVFGGRYFNGSLDEIAVYNTDLSASQISAIYASQTAVPEPLSLAVAAVALLLRRRRRC